ncbi:unnamed protein product, partial [Rotaria sordida]
KLNELTNEFRRLNDKTKCHVIIQDLSEPHTTENSVRKTDAFNDIQIDIIINNADLDSAKLILQTPLDDMTF